MVGNLLKSVPFVTVPMNPAGFPLLTNTIHILGTSGESAFTNYPNPFAAGREAVAAATG